MDLKREPTRRPSVAGYPTLSEVRADRRRFLQLLGRSALGAAALGLAGCEGGPPPAGADMFDIGGLTSDVGDVGRLDAEPDHLSGEDVRWLPGKPDGADPDLGGEPDVPEPRDLREPELSGIAPDVGDPPDVPVAPPDAGPDTAPDVGPDAGPDTAQDPPVDGDLPRPDPGR